MACCRSSVGKKGLIGVGEALEKVSILHGIMRPSGRKMWNEEALTMMYQALRAFAIITRTTINFQNIHQQNNWAGRGNVQDPLLS